MDSLQKLSETIEDGFGVRPIAVFAKVLSPNDDAGRHGVLIPNEAYLFFPDLPIPDVTQNSTAYISGLDIASKARKEFGWKYYERYPERRITRLSPRFNVMDAGRRLAVFVKAESADGSFVWLADVRLEGQDNDFTPLLNSLFQGAPTAPGAFVQLPFAGASFRQDSTLIELLDHYDRIHSLGWIDTMRVGDTGIGYTFETLVGIEENNDQNADYKGIELKCKLTKDSSGKTGKINLFQMGPTWIQPMPGIDRLKSLGLCNSTGTYSCYSQVTPIENNLGLRISVPAPPTDLGLLKNNIHIGKWAREHLAKRLEMKHSRALFVKAESRSRNGVLQYHYNEAIYCERPDIDRFVDMIEKRQIVFEFAMTERPQGKLRNHGYPWRLVDERKLDSLFALQVKLRG